MMALVIAFYLLALVPMISGIILWYKNTNWKDKHFSQMLHDDGSDSTNFGKPLGKALFFSSAVYFLGATLYLLLGDEWLWQSCVVIFVGFILFWILFFLFLKGARAFLKAIINWAGLD